jgi:hypothetical protein
MIVKTIGKPQHVSLKLCRDAVLIYGEFLLGKRLSNNVRVIVDFDPDLDKTNDYALCEAVSGDYPPRDFEISISPTLRKKRILLTLAHEMTHVKQYARGELRDIKAAKVKWNNEIFNTDNMNYWFLPWEVEAMGMESGLYFHFLENIKK